MSMATPLRTRVDVILAAAPISVASTSNRAEKKEASKPKGSVQNPVKKVTASKAAVRPSRYPDQRMKNAASVKEITAAIQNCGLSNPTLPAHQEITAKKVKKANKSRVESRMPLPSAVVADEV